MKILFICELGILLLTEKIKVFSSKKFQELKKVEVFNKIKSGNIIPELKDFLKSISDTILVFEDNLRSNLGKEDFKVEKMSDNLFFEIQSKKIELMVEANFAENINEVKDRIRNFAVEFSALKLKELSTEIDLHIIQSIQALDEIEKTFNLLSTRVREWYGLHFPELNSVIEDPTAYSKIIKEVGMRKNFTKDKIIQLGFPEGKIEKILNLARNSKGGEIREEDFEEIVLISSEILNLSTLKKSVSKHVENTIEIAAPNISSIAGPIVGARMIARASGLNRLARLSSSTIQVLGAEKALFRALKTGSKPPKHGVIFQHRAVHSAPKWQRGKIARSLAAKIAIAARVDFFRGVKEKGIDDKLQLRIDEIKLKYGKAPNKNIFPRKMRKKGTKVGKR
jgi:nucleolar protein 56